jgi:hypothetical protein
MCVKSICILLFLFCFNGFYGICQSPEIGWERKIVRPGANVFTQVIEDVKGGFTVTGYTHPDNKTDLDFWMVRFSPEGEIILEKSFGTGNNDLPSGLSQFPNEEYIITGNTTTEDKSSQVLVVRVDKEGNIIWKNEGDKIEDVVVKDVVTMDDGTFIMGGAKKVSEGTEKIWVAKLDGEGELVWEKTFGEKGIAQLQSLKKLPDGGFVVAAQVALQVISDNDLWMFRFDRKDNLLWEKQFPSPEINIWPECVCCSPDNNFMVAGWYGTCMNDINSENPIFDYDLFLSKISPDGKIIWSKNIDSEGSEGGNTIVVRPDEKILLGGKKETSFLGRVGSWLLVTDQEGTVVSEMVFPFNFGNDQAVEIINSSDGGFVVIGPGELDLNQQNSDGWIKKFKAF